MASTSITVQRVAHERRYGPTDWWGGWRTCILACVGLVALFVGLASYMGLFAWSAGLDASSPVFGTYWRSMLVAEEVGIGAGTLGWWIWLGHTGRALPRRVTREEEVRRIVVFWGLVGATSVVLFFLASFFINADGAWHQTTVRDTAFTPTHIVLFYCAFPLGITMTIGTYLYGRTRLPKVYGPELGFPWSFFFLIAASVTEMMQVALNEWGHSLWIAEEIFAAPFHWPFVLYGWLALALFALWAETLLRLMAIERELDDETAETVR